MSISLVSGKGWMNLGVACVVVLFGVACGSGGGGKAPSAAARAEAEQLFSARCTACHGARGRGDGVAAAGLTPPPANFGDGAWQSKVTDEHIEKVIKLGGAAVGKSGAMPPNPDLADKPEMVAALRFHIRSLKM